MKFLAAVAMVAFAAPVHAQAVPDPNQFIIFATQVSNNIDQGRAAVVWDRAAAPLKSSVPKDRFVAQIAAKKQQNGATVSRVWQSIVRTNVTVSDRPLVQHPMVTVTFATTTNRKITYNEVVQFTMGQNNLWQTAAYIN